MKNIRNYEKKSLFALKRRLRFRIIGKLYNATERCMILKECEMIYRNNYQYRPTLLLLVLILILYTITLSISTESYIKLSYY